LNRRFQGREDRSGNLSIEACLHSERRDKKLKHVYSESTAYEGNWRKQGGHSLWLGFFVREVVPLLLTPAQHPCLMQQSSCLCFPLVEPFPLRHRNFLCSVATSKSNKAILKHPCLVPEQTFIFCAFCANIKAQFRLM
jgi:hypothetical protein